MKIGSRSDIYSTTDWEEIVWLIANRQRVSDTAREDQHRVRFLFSDVGACRRLVDILTFNREERAEQFRQILAAIRVAREILRKTP